MTVLFFAFLATPLCRSFDGDWLFFFAKYLFICRLPFIKSEIIAIFKYCIRNTWQILAISIILTASNLGNCKNRSISKGVWRRDKFYFSVGSPFEFVHCLLCKTNCRLLCSGIQCSLLFDRLNRWHSWIHTYNGHTCPMSILHRTETINEQINFY